jgi:hypothetical protein
MLSLSSIQVKTILSILKMKICLVRVFAGKDERGLAQSKTLAGRSDATAVAKRLGLR